jgi:Cobalamin synthesis protein cobW C-terminal domain
VRSHRWYPLQRDGAAGSNRGPDSELETRPDSIGSAHNNAPRARGPFTRIHKLCRRRRAVSMTRGASHRSRAPIVLWRRTPPCSLPVTDPHARRGSLRWRHRGRQLVAADVVVLNKIDLVDEGDADATVVWLHDVAAGARIVASRTPRCDATWCSAYVALMPAGSDDLSPAWRRRAGYPALDYGSAFATRTFRSSAPLSEPALRDAPDALPQGVLRAKGFVRFDSALQRARACSRVRRRGARQPQRCRSSMRAVRSTHGPALQRTDPAYTRAGARQKCRRYVRIRQSRRDA